jgi:hypothetical protein
MDKTLIERLAREAGLVTAAGADGILTASIPETDFPHEGPTLFEFPESLVRFASGVAEVCAKVVLSRGPDYTEDRLHQKRHGGDSDIEDIGAFYARKDAAEAIRAKFRSAT